MRENPGLDEDGISAALAARYGLRVESVAYLPVGFDHEAAVFKVAAADGRDYFLKIRFGPFDEASLLVPRALIDRGIPNVLGPPRTLARDLWVPLEAAGRTMALYPFVAGRDAAAAGLTDEQWRAFGATLRAIHDGDVGERFRGRLPEETFALPSAGEVRRVLDLAHDRDSVVASPAAARFAEFWRAEAERIRAMLARAEALGRALSSRPFELVLCHGDIHAANILVGDDGRIRLVDWDGPLLAPRERDLLFVVGSVIARAVRPHEEARFFDGYGPVAIAPEALVYYRFERIVQDLGEIGNSVLLDPDRGENARAEEAELAMSFFAPGGDIDRAEAVDLSRVPTA